MSSSNIVKGVIAGFIATVVLSILMLAKGMMGLMPDLNVIKMLAKMMGASTPAMGWAAHFAIGAILWGGLFALFGQALPGKSLLLKGVIFGALAWVLMMIAVMPMAGAGLFGMKLGMMAPAMTLILHLIFGAVLGGVYSGLSRSAAAAG